MYLAYISQQYLCICSYFYDKLSKLFYNKWQYIYISIIFLDLITVRQSMEKLPNKYHGAKVWNKLPMNNCYLGFFFPLHADIQRQRVWRIWFCSLYNPASPAHKYKAVLCCGHSWDIRDLNQFRFLRRRRRRRPGAGLTSAWMLTL